jgi:hypothetical protein
MHKTDSCINTDEVDTKLFCLDEGRTVKKLESFRLRNRFSVEIP